MIDKNVGCPYPPNMTQDIQDIVSRLQLARDRYYNQDDDESLIMSDAEFDRLEALLRNLDPTNDYFSSIGSDVRGGKILLPYPMGSLDQVYTNDAAKWIADNGWLDELFVITNKMDGTSGVNVHDKSGRLSISYSRGNGTYGADITRHVKRFKNLPKVSKPCVVRVEFIIAEESFQKILASGQVFKNSRNYVAGRMNASDGDDLFYEYAECIATALIEPVLNKDEQIAFLQEMGYKTPPSAESMGKDIDDDFLLAILADQRQRYPFAIDGLVIDLNSVKIRESLSRKSSSLNPMYSKKFKPDANDNLATTTVVAVLWEASKHGYLKPRIEIEPVELSGVTITYASGYNARHIQEKGVGKGAVITLTRAGDVIPRLVEVLSPVEPQLPDFDEHGAWSWDDNGVEAVLDVENDDVKINRLIAAFDAIGVDALREGNILKLWERSYRDLVSIIKMTKQELVSILGVNGEKIYDSLKSKLNPISRANLAGSSQIFPRGMGRRKFAKLYDAYPNAEFDFTVEMVKAAEGFSDKTAESVVSGLPAFLQFLKDIEGYYSFEGIKEVSENAECAGVVAVFTGVRSKELEAAIESKGGTIGSSISSKTTLLICKDPNPAKLSGKLQKANDLGIKLMSLEDAEALYL